MKTGIVILNYKGLDNTLECLQSIKHFKDLLIVVVDNFSQDNSVPTLEKQSGIVLLKNSDNLGYSGGNNVGIRYCIKEACDLVVILNNDTILRGTTITELIAGSKKSDIVSPKIYFAKGFEYHKNRYREKDMGNVIWYAGGRIDWENVIGIHEGVDQIDSGQFNLARDIDYATGACFLIKKAVFDKIGLFDEKYFLYLEDMDLSVRAKKAGFKIMYQPTATLWHKNASSSGGSGSKLQDYYISRNRLLFAFKYAKPKTKIAVLKQIITQSTNSARRGALVDFLTFNFGKSERNFN